MSLARVVVISGLRLPGIEARATSHHLSLGKLLNIAGASVFLPQTKDSHSTCLRVLLRRTIIH